MKIINCENIINGQRCKAPVTKKRGRFCAPCAKERCRVSNNLAYHRNKKGWEPYYKTCACGAEFLVETRKQGKRIDCDECRKKRAYPNGNFRNRKATKAKPNLNKSSKRSVMCKCPTCFEVRSRKIYLADPEEYKNGKLFWKRCDLCKKALDNIDCPDAGAYNVGGKHERI